MPDSDVTSEVSSSRYLVSMYGGTYLNIKLAFSIQTGKPRDQGTSSHLEVEKALASVYVGFPLGLSMRAHHTEEVACGIGVKKKKGRKKSRKLKLLHFVDVSSHAQLNIEWI